jgi:hypothetical protein
MPQLAYDGEILALSAGALHYPRWGNGITFSLDGGQTWTDLINFAPLFTTGPWKDHTAHWVGVVNITVERK